MKAYQIKSKNSETFWTVQLPTEESSKEEVIAEAILTEDFLADEKIGVSEKDKNYLILELAQMVRLNSVEEKIATEKNRPKRKARKTLKQMFGYQIIYEDYLPDLYIEGYWKCSENGEKNGIWTKKDLGKMEKRG